MCSLRGARSGKVSPPLPAPPRIHAGFIHPLPTPRPPSTTVAQRMNAGRNMNFSSPRRASSAAIGLAPGTERLGSWPQLTSIFLEVGLPRNLRAGLQLAGPRLGSGPVRRSARHKELSMNLGVGDGSSPQPSRPPGQTGGRAVPAPVHGPGARFENRGGSL